MEGQLPLILTVDGLAYSGGEDMIDLLRLILSRDYEADLQVVSPSHVLEIAKHCKPHLILIGHRPLHGGTLMGGEIVRDLKSDPDVRNIPVLMLEGLHNTAQVAEGCGADAYLEVPFGPSEFVDTIGRLVASKHNVAE